MHIYAMYADETARLSMPSGLFRPQHTQIIEYSTEQGYIIGCRFLFLPGFSYTHTDRPEASWHGETGVVPDYRKIGKGIERMLGGGSLLLQ